MGKVTRSSARSFLLPVLCFILGSMIGGPALFRIGTCMAEELPPPVPELRAEAKAEREEELLYLNEEIVSIAVRHEQPISRAAA